ncbi:hypothetical protein F4780DRAFT_224339 [Xylariomycetidae sp. FL0641]|nr:hypothetical protein F4780DRAFT_224339 [Xylariomycetidae sp. FL0641]
MLVGQDSRQVKSLPSRGNPTTAILALCNEQHVRSDYQAGLIASTRTLSLCQCPSHELLGARLVGRSSRSLLKTDVSWARQSETAAKSHRRVEQIVFAKNFSSLCSTFTRPTNEIVMGLNPYRVQILLHLDSSPGTRSHQLTGKSLMTCPSVKKTRPLPPPDLLARCVVQTYVPLCLAMDGRLPRSSQVMNVSLNAVFSPRTPLSGQENLSLLSRVETTESNAKAGATWRSVWRVGEAGPGRGSSQPALPGCVVRLHRRRDRQRVWAVSLGAAYCMLPSPPPRRLEMRSIMLGVRSPARARCQDEVEAAPALAL